MNKYIDVDNGHNNGMITSLLFSSSPLGKMANTFADDIFKCIFVNGNVRISFEILLIFVPTDSNDNKSALV